MSSNPASVNNKTMYLVSAELDIVHATHRLSKVKLEKAEIHKKPSPESSV